MTRARTQRAVAMFEAVRVPLPSEAVRRRLGEAIRTGIFRVGSKLPSERSLATQMEVSRPTIREAIRALTEAGILEVRPGSGGGAYVISEIVPLSFATDPLERPTSIAEAVQVRRLLLPWVAQMASLHAGPADHDRMRQAIAFGEAALASAGRGVPYAESVEAVLIASTRFDLAMAQATGNSLILHLMTLLIRWIEPLRPPTLQNVTDLAAAIDVVRRCFTAIQAHDPAALAAIVDTRLIVLEAALERL